jgi:hypothetical protein
VNGKVVPHPDEYDEVNFGLVEIMKYFIFLYFFLFLPSIAIYQETFRPGAVLHRYIKTKVYGETPIVDYLAMNTL